MGMQLCKLCKKDSQETSSGEFVIAFEGELFQFSDLLPHYILEHGYWPDDKFVESVMGKKPSPGNHLSSKVRPEMVGYIAYIKENVESLINNGRANDTRKCIISIISILH